MGRISSILFLVILGFYSFGQSDTCLTTLELGLSFPPVTDAEQRAFALEKMEDLGVKKIRFGEDWSNREPSPGMFNWGPIDSRLNWAEENGYEVLLTIQSNGPDWACSDVQNDRSCVFSDNADFKNYIDSLLQRHPNKISKIQFGNEWQSDFWYAGGASDFIAANNMLYSSVQTYSPETEVVLGGFTTISLRFLAGCNGYVEGFYDDEGEFYDPIFLTENCEAAEILTVKERIDSVLRLSNYDLLDIHLYDDVEQWDEYYYNFIDTITKPVIVTEFGGPNMNYEPYSELYQADRVFQYIKKLDSLEIEEAYFFKLVEGTANPAHATSGLIDDDDLLEKPCYYVFQSFVSCSNSLPELSMGKGIRFYPNPMNEQTTIEFSGDAQDKQITIYDASGKSIRIYKEVNGNYFTIERNGMAPGFYYIKIRQENQVIARGELIVVD